MLGSEGRRYKILGVLGKGGFGTVYEATLLGEGGFTRRVALKVLNPEVAGTEDVARRLRDEARLLGLLRHRAILQVDGLVQLGTEGGDDARWTVVMELIEGVDLQQLLRAHGPVPPGPALEIVGEVASALHVAYTTTAPEGGALGLLHRDIKPPNILLTDAGETKVLDFGIARAEFSEREAETRSVLYGSIAYMPPERLELEELHAGDVYSLGAVLYELLTGEGFGKASIREDRHTAAVQAAGARASEAAGTAVGTLVAEMLAYEPEHRPTARDVESRCRALRAQVGGSWLRDWAERVVPPALVARGALGIDDLSGSVAIERRSGPQSGSVEVVPAPPKRARTGLLLGGLGTVGCVGVAAAGVVAVVAVMAGVVLLPRASAVATVDPPGDDTDGIEAPELERPDTDPAVADLDTTDASVGARPEPEPTPVRPVVIGTAPEATVSRPEPVATTPRPEPVATPTRPVSETSLAQPVVDSRPPDPVASEPVPTDPEPAPEAPKATPGRMVPPWTSLGLDLGRGGAVVQSDPKMLIFKYDDRDVLQTGAWWRKSLEKKGWTVIFYDDSTGSVVMTLAWDGHNYAFTAAKAMGWTMCSMSLVD